MEESIISQKDTTTVNINKTEICETQPFEMIPVKQTHGCQPLMYLISRSMLNIVVYFLSVGLFYLVACLLKSKYVECQLECSEDNLQCQCQLQSRVSWVTPSYVELSWSETQVKNNQFDEFSIVQAIIYNNQTRIELQTEFQTQKNCFPNKCLAFVGTTNQSIGDDSKFILKFNHQMSLLQNQHPKVIIREANPDYPQLSTQAQLGINLVFGMMVGIFVFFRQKMQIVSTLNIKNNKKAKIDFPADILALNSALQISRSKAARFLLSGIGKNILTYSVQDQQYKEFGQTF